MVKLLDLNPDTEVFLQCQHTYNTYLQGTKWVKRAPIFRDINFKGKLRMIKYFNQFLNRRYSNTLLSKNGVDVFHPTYYDPYFLEYLGSIPLVITVHDLTYELMNDVSPAIKAVLEWKRLLIEKASHIITVSDNTRRDVIEYYKYSPEKVTTAHLAGGFPPSFFSENKLETKSKLPDQYLLFVGSRQGYKNFNSFIKEASPFLKTGEFSIVIAGGGPLTLLEKSMISNLGIEQSISVFSHVSDTFLFELYSRATVFVFPSLYEGFGIPVLEAMQCGCPTILSNNSSLPEVGGTASVYFDPYQEGALNQALVSVLQNTNQLVRMKVEGIEQAKKFNWDRTASIHLQVYHDLIRHRGDN